LSVPFSFEIYTKTQQLPRDWDRLAQNNIFLTADYLQILETSAPVNMRCHFIGIFNDRDLVGIALSQFLDLSEVESFGDRDSCLKTKIRNVVFKNFSSKVLFIGNNMLTGQNAFAFSHDIAVSAALQTLCRAAAQICKNLKKQGLETHLIVWKDFNGAQVSAFKIPEFRGYFQFQTQPNMIFDIRKGWETFDDYIAALLKKYRDQYKRARKKSEGLTKRKMSLEDIIAFEATIHKLYMTVAQNAPFNTFYLPQNHFATFKKSLGDRLLFYGYFDNGILVGFNTLIKNGCDIDTYFLGYDENCQREKMLYLNMLYDMSAYSINKDYSRVIFARTALEIKSSVGAKPADAYGFIRHTNRAANLLMSRLFRYFEPEMVWHERHPFKD
jgi:predicted N-acyltransferase